MKSFILLIKLATGVEMPYEYGHDEQSCYNRAEEVVNTYKGIESVKCVEHTYSIKFTSLKK